MTISSDDIIECLKRDINELSDRYEAVVQQFMEQKEELERLKAQYEQHAIDHRVLVKRTEYVAWTQVCGECAANHVTCPFESHWDCPKYQERFKKLMSEADERSRTD